MLLLDAKKFGVAIAIVLLGAIVFAPSVMAKLEPTVDVEGTGLRTGGDLKGAVTTVINIVLGLTGLLALIVLIYGGILYIISLGDESGAEKAKRVILYAIIGLIVIGLSAVIVNFILGAVVGGGGGGGGNPQPPQPPKNG